MISRLLIISSFLTLHLMVNAKNILWTASWSADGKFIATGGDDGSLTIFHAKDLSIYKEYRFDSTTVAQVAWHPKENLLAVIGHFQYQNRKRNLAQIIDATTGTIIQLGDIKNGGRGICWSPDGNSIATTGNGIIHIFTKAGKEVLKINHASDNTLFSIAWHPFQNKIAVTEGDLRIYDTTTGKELSAIKTNDHPKGVMCVAWHPTGEFLVTGDYGHEHEGGEPSYLKFWKEDGTLLNVLKGSKSVYRGLKWNKDGTRLATASDALRIWDKEGNLLFTATNAGVDLWGIDWDDSNQKMITSGEKNSVCQWSRDGKLLLRK